MGRPVHEAAPGSVARLGRRVRGTEGVRPGGLRSPRLMPAGSSAGMRGSVAVAATDPRRVVETVWRMESARIVAGLARLVRDIGLAEELAQDALVIALEQWPVSGVPDQPGRWLMATAKHRAIDLLRRQSRYTDKLAEIGRATPHAVDPDLAAGLDDYVGDDLLRLIF